MSPPTSGEPLPEPPGLPQAAGQVSPQPVRAKWWSTPLAWTVVVVLGIAGLVVVAYQFHEYLTSAVVLVVVFGFAAAHYLIWGKWLSTILRDEEVAPTAPPEEQSSRRQV